MTALEISGLGKSYKQYKSEWRRVLSWVGVPTSPIQESWVLRDIDLSIPKGQALAIVGQNGAGKSTMLKLIAGTLQPSEGVLQVHGSISAILELGMGFNPDFTGRQNAQHGLGLMGHSQRDISVVMRSLEEFAEIGKYFDKPIRTYSSGMQMRVAFAVATAFRPDILIVDEAMSVGDTYFQHKSFERIQSFRKDGTALLIVSHDHAAILSLCDRAVLLDQAGVAADGGPEEVLDYYNAVIAQREQGEISFSALSDGRIQTTSGSGEAKVESVELFDGRGKSSEYLNVGETVKIIIKVTVINKLESLVLGFGIKNQLGQFVYGTNTWHTNQVIENPLVGHTYHFEIVFRNDLGVGSYSVATALHAGNTHLDHSYEWTDYALVFRVVNTEKEFFTGCNWLEPSIKIDG